jgi:hypothetical protein
MRQVRIGSGGYERKGILLKPKGTVHLKRGWEGAEYPTAQPASPLPSATSPHRRHWRVIFLEPSVFKSIFGEHRRAETNPDIRAQFEEQAEAYRKIAANRAKVLGSGTARNLKPRHHPK